MPEAATLIAGIEIDRVCRIAGQAAVASRDLLRRKPSATARRQEGRDIKVIEDGGSEALILAMLRAHSPWKILSEEAGWIGGRPLPDEPYWVVDPLDGSFNHHRGVPLCCTSVAVAVGMVPLAGAIFDFNRDELFCGGAGLGLTLNGTELAASPYRPQIVATGFPVGGDDSAAGIAAVVEQAASFAKIRMIGSAALALAWVAAGRFDAYQESGTRWWDVAGGLALVEGAGGRIRVSGASIEAKLDVWATRGA
jgi:myo-inositol-1(or 4)-monophosphatase